MIIILIIVIMTTFRFKNSLLCCSTCASRLEREASTYQAGRNNVLASPGHCLFQIYKYIFPIYMFYLKLFRNVSLHVQFKCAQFVVYCSAAYAQQNDLILLVSLFIYSSC